MQIGVAPLAHTGEGLFFSSKLFDRFVIESGELSVSFANDQCNVHSIPHRQGTLIRMEIANDSTRTTNQVFDQFCGGDEYAFYKTRFFLSLAAFEGSLISRSQAKRVAVRFEKFGEVELSFSGVESISQAFADELLRVWPLAHPQTKLLVVNANTAVLKMVGHIKGRNDLPQVADAGSNSLTINAPDRHSSPDSADDLSEKGRHMPRTDLEVPFAQKDEAKRLGARWDAQQRVWYIPDGVDPAPFGKWLPKPPDVNVRSDHYYILESSTSCWKCGGTTRVFALALPLDHEVMEAIEDDDMEFESDEAYEAWVNSPESSEWRVAGMQASIHYVDYVSSAVAARIRALTPHFRIDFSKTTESYYWMNHCECCGMKQGDFDLHCEPQGAFVPLRPEDATAMVLYRVDEPLEASYGGYTYDVEFFDAMRRA